MFSIVTPYRSDSGQRDKIFAWVMKRYSTFLPEVEVIVSADTGGQYFKRSQALNNGVRQATHDVILIADADAVVSISSLLHGVKLLTDKVSCVIPYNTYYMLSRLSTACLLDRPPVQEVRLDIDHNTEGYENSNASLVFVTKEKYWDIGGFDERFVAWAPEDQCWYGALTTLHGPSQRVTSGHAYHLWHPTLWGHRQDNPYYRDAEILWKQYKAAIGNPDKMRKLVTQ